MGIVMNCENPQVVDGERIVLCRNCGSIWSPAFKSPLWWAAKQRADKGFLDAYCCSGLECGCVKKRIEPSAPFRVFGYTGMMEDFDIPCETFVEAVRTYRKFDMDVIFIHGVSQAVEQKLRYSWLS